MIAAFADYNNDGYPDMLVYDFWGNGMRLYNGGAGLNFTLAHTLPTGTHGAKGIFEDFDNDGDLDIINVSSGSSAVIALHIFENTGGNFQKHSYAGISRRFVPFIWAKDMDGDGRKDVVCLNAGLNKIEKATVWLQNADRSFALQAEETLHEKMTYGSRFSYAWEDMNEDGLEDLLFLEDFSAGITPDFRFNVHLAYAGAAQPFIGGRYDVSGPEGTGFAGRFGMGGLVVAHGDIDNDGVGDMVTLNRVHELSGEDVDMRKLLILHDPMNKKGNFMVQHLSLDAMAVKNNGFGRGLMLADLNRDNDLELVVLGMDDTLRIFDNPTHSATGISDARLNKYSFSIYPNPAKDKLHIDFGSLNSSHVLSVKIYGMDGKLLQVVPGVLPDQSNGVPVGLLSKGNYLLFIEMDNGDAYGKMFVKE